MIAVCKRSGKFSNRTSSLGRLSHGDKARLGTPITIFYCMCEPPIRWCDLDLWLFVIFVSKLHPVDTLLCLETPSVGTSSCLLHRWLSSLIFARCFLFLLWWHVAIFLPNLPLALNSFALTCHLLSRFTPSKLKLQLLLTILHNPQHTLPGAHKAFLCFSALHI